MRILTPLIPDGDQAREWAEQELADPVYRLAEPTWFDRAAQAVRDAVAAFFSPSLPPEWAAVLALIAGAVVVAIVIVALLVWGVPRRSRARRARNDLLFGDLDARSASGLRAAAQSAARRGEWDEAIVLQFRAAARGAQERDILDLQPGTTAQRFGAQADARVPDAARGVVHAAAVVFDDVRYLRRPGTSDQLDLVIRADQVLQQVRPVGDAEPVEAVMR